MTELELQTFCLSAFAFSQGFGLPALSLAGTREERLRSRRMVRRLFMLLMVFMLHSD